MTIGQVLSKLGSTWIRLLFIKASENDVRLERQGEAQCSLFLFG